MSIDVWYAQIEAAPDNWELRLLFADWLEENEEPILASGFRWQVKVFKLIGLICQPLQSIEDWYKQIESSPDNWTLRSVFADWLEESEQPRLCAGQRWQVQHQRRPDQSTLRALPPSRWRDPRHWEHVPQLKIQNLPVRFSQIADPLFSLIVRTVDEGVVPGRIESWFEHCYRVEFIHTQDAELALAEALHRMRQS